MNISDLMFPIYNCVKSHFYSTTMKKSQSPCLLSSRFIDLIVFEVLSVVVLQDFTKISFFRHTIRKTFEHDVYEGLLNTFLRCSLFTLDSYVYNGTRRTK